MKKLFYLFLVILTISSASVFAQNVDMSKRIIITMKGGNSDFNLKFKADNPNTAIIVENKDKSGENDNETYNIVVGTDWRNLGGNLAVYSTSVLEIYGDVSGIDCSGNADAISKIDFSGNDIINDVILWGNSFSTSATNDIYCYLPDRTGKPAGSCVMLQTDDNNIIAATSNNARNKNWEVKYTDGRDIPSNGSFHCIPPVDETQKIIIVHQNRNLNLNFKADSDTKIKIANGGTTEEIVVGTDWSAKQIRARSKPIKIIGAINGLKCANNRITQLDISGNNNLKELDCSNNEITYFALENTNTTSYSDKLTVLNCSNNKLTKLDLSRQLDIKELHCYGNKFPTEVINKIYCSLPTITGAPGKCYTLKSPTDVNHANVIAATSENPRTKNWEVKYFSNNEDIPSNGDFECPVLNLDSYITLSTNKGQKLSLYLKAKNDETPIRIVNGSTVTNTTIGKNAQLSHSTKITAEDGNIVIYGNVSYFYSTGNGNVINSIALNEKSTLKTLLCANNNITNLDISKATNLIYLACNGNNLSSLNISNNTKLQSLNCNSTGISSLDLRKHTALEVLDCSNNPLPSLNISKNVNLIGLNCSNLNLTSLDLSKHSKITKLNCSNNKISNLDVSKHTELTNLECSNNRLRNLDISKNTKLFLLNCSNLKLTSLDLSNHSALAHLDCSNNQLSNLDISKNEKLQTLNCSGNLLTSLNLENLDKTNNKKTIICYNNPFNTDAVNDIYCSISRKEGVLSELFILNTENDANHATVIDANSKMAKSKNWGVKYYANNDRAKQKEITSLGSYDCRTDMSKFITLEVVKGQQMTLNFKSADGNTPVHIRSGNQRINHVAKTITGFDKLKVTPENDTLIIYGNLYGLRCIKNNISAINTSNAPQLAELYCSENKLTSLDISSNSKLTHLDCSNNPLKSIDISKNKELTSLECYSSGLNSLNLSENTKLTQLNCGENNLRNLDISNNTLLSSIFCSNNKLTHLNLENNPQLRELSCAGNLFSIDATNDLYCSLNQATDTAVCYMLRDNEDINSANVMAANSNIARGKNWKVRFISPKNDIPSTSNYDCNTDRTKYLNLTVGDEKEIKFNIKAKTDKTPILVVSGSNRKDYIAGTDWNAEDFTITSDGTTITIFGDFISFKCDDNEGNLTDINTGNIAQLQELSCNNNSISSFENINNAELTHLYCRNTNVKDLELPKCEKLAVLDCSNNSLSSLNISNNTQLRELTCQHIALSKFDISKNTDLIKLDCSNNSLNSLDVSKNTKLTHINCSKTKLGSLDVSNNIELESLVCNDNNIPSLLFTNNKRLKEVYYFNNPMTTNEIDYMLCSLPDRTNLESGTMYTLQDENDVNSMEFVDVNSENSKSRNWKILYYNSGDIIKTEGFYECGSLPNMHRYITLTVTPNKPINIKLKGDEKSNRILIVGGSKEKLFSISSDWSKNISFTSDSNKVTIYGNIKVLDCRNNLANIQGVDIHNNYEVQALYCRNNSITNIYVSRNSNLELLDCANNSLEYLHLEGVSNIDTLICNNNRLTNLNIKSNKKLKFVDCSANSLTELLLSNPELLNLYVNNNSLPSLEIGVSKKLTTLNCANNLIPDLDLNNNPNLVEITCYNNPFSREAANAIYCALQSRFRKSKGILLMLSRINPLYTSAILSSNAKIATDKNWIVGYYNPASNKIEEITTTGTALCGSSSNLSRSIVFNTDRLDHQCSVKISGAREETFVRITSGTFTKDYKIGTNDTLLNFSVMDNKVTLYGDVVKFEFLSDTKMTALDIQNNNLIEYLNCNNNKLQTLDVSNNLKLEKLICSNNKIANLKLGKNSELTELDCQNNTITSLELNACNKLSNLTCNNNNLKALDINTNTKLIEIFCNDNEIDNIDASNNTELITINADNNKLSNLEISKCLELSHLSANNNQLTSLDVSKCSKLNILYVNNNKLTSIALDQHEELQRIFANKNQIKKIALSKIPKLGVLSINYNQLEELDISENHLLTELFCNQSNLKHLDISKKPLLRKLECNKNKIASLKLEDNKALTHIACYGNSFTTKGIDSLYCSLPEKSEDTHNKLFLLYDESDDNKEIVQASNSNNAKSKKWVTLYYKRQTNKEVEIATAGTYVCGSGNSSFVNKGFSSGISVFPNPATNKVRVQLDDSVNETLILVDLSGRAVLLTDVVAGKANIDVSNLTAGTYFIRVGNLTKKLTVK